MALFTLRRNDSNSPMIQTKERSTDRNLSEEALEVFQDAISPEWLLKVVKWTSVVFFAFVIFAFAA